MNRDARYWKLGSCMIDVTKISFIAFDETAREGAIVVDGQLIKLNINKDIYIDFIKAFAIEHPVTKTFA